MEEQNVNENQLQAMNELEEIIKGWVVISKWKKDLEFYDDLRQRMLNV